MGALLGRDPVSPPNSRDPSVPAGKARPPARTRLNAPMRILRPLAAAALPVLLTLAGCSSSSDSTANAGASSGDLWVVSCSLGCTNGLGGSQVFCSVVNTFQNQELSILFSEPIDLFSVNTSSFRVINVANGTSPSGQFFLDPLDPRRLIFRPSLFFDDNGNPIFGFTENTAYRITIPGTAQGDSAPFIRSQGGRNNVSRLECTIQTSEGLTDPVPGEPSAEIRVTLVTSYDGDGNPISFANDVLMTKSPELVNVFRNSPVNFRFNDIMNVATLVNPATGTAPFIKIEIDDDGDLATLDRVPVEGTFSFVVDQESLETLLTFIPTSPLPSAGSGAPANPRKLVVTIPTTVQDLVANSVLVENGGGTTAAVPELSAFGETVLPTDGGEDFTTNAFEDIRRGGAIWGTGRLAPGLTGGAGLLGDLIVHPGESILLNSDSNLFPLNLSHGANVPQVANVLTNPDPTGGGLPGEVDHVDDFPTSITVTDGGFSFATITVLPGGSLRIEGANASRLYSRGEARVESGGTIDMTGHTPAGHDSMGVISPENELTVSPNAAHGKAGGWGADRFDMAVNNSIVNSTSSLPDEVSDPIHYANDYPALPPADTDGRRGMGINGALLGGGPGGPQYPAQFPEASAATNPPDNSNHQLTFNLSDPTFSFGQTDNVCRVMTIGRPGGGAAYATSGTAGHAESFYPTADYPLGDTNNPPDVPGADWQNNGLADPDENNANYVERKLQWTFGNLRGGAGGGGGGNHAFGTHATGYDLDETNDCIHPNALSSHFKSWHDHSGAQGGYGGGAMQFVSGKKLVINGRIDMRGGNGGSSRTPVTPPPGIVHDFGQYAMPGGGGTGGALKLRSLVVEIAAVPDRIDMRGGDGGSGFSTGTRGGDGGAGLLRIEDNVGGVDRTVIAPSVAPILPNSSLDFISVDAGSFTTAPRFRPDSVSASSSCWMQPEGNFFGLNFIEDEEDEDTGDPAKMGWNMDVIWDDGTGEVNIPFRGTNSLFPVSFENQFGNLLGYDLTGPETAAPIAVRFQGARITGDSVDLCDLDLNDSGSTIVPGSVTPWVDHPEILNTFSPIPNIVRYTIVFDRTVDGGDVPGLQYQFIRGVTNVWIRTIPD